MHTAELTIPAPARPRRTKRVTAIAVTVTAVVLALAGAVALAANVFRDGDGYFNSPTESFTSTGYAIAMKSVDISDAPQWALDAGVNRVRVKAHGDRALFMGIARAADVDRYLRGTEHDDVSYLTYHPFAVDYDHADGHAPSRPPLHESFWIASTHGVGNLTLAWKPRPGNWRAIVMNENGTRGVAAELRFGADSALLWWVGAALLGLSVVGGTAAALLYRSARA